MTGSMNQEKIGKLIAKMRKQKDLTQRELGEMVGVGFRAVSKWERGQTMPDISIINELSTILGISSDELLNGELMPKDDNQRIPTAEIDSKSLKNGNKRKLLLLIIPILMIIAFIGILIIRNNNKPVEYVIQSLHPDEYRVDGTLIVKGNKLIVKINKIEFQEYEFCQTIIRNFEYNVMLNDTFLFGLGNTEEYNNINGNMSIKKLCQQFQLNYNVTTKLINQNLNNKNIIVKLVFKDLNNDTIIKNVETVLLKQ